MRKLSILLSILLLSNIFLVGCNKEEEKENEVVNKNLTSVEITIPSELNDESAEEFNKEDYLKQEGIKDVRLNEDNSITMKITKSKHKEMMEEMKLELDETIEEFIEDEDTPYIKDITSTTNYREINIIVDKAGYENAFDLTPFVLGMSAGFYQTYLGEEFKTTININDEETGENIGSVTYPDAFEEDEDDNDDNEEGEI